MIQIKTNAIRALEANKIDIRILNYDSKKGIDGNTVAELIGESPDKVFKTLVTEYKGENFVFVIPVNSELDLKKAAKAAEVKSIQMIYQKDLLKTTGYIRGGCSPVGMKKQFKTFINSSALDLDKIIVSAGKVGIQVELSAEDLAKITDAQFIEII